MPTPSPIPLRRRSAGPIGTGSETGGGFTLVELLVVIAIGAIIMLLAVPALRPLSGAASFSKSVAFVAGALQQARAHAIGSNTYVWVGFFEEDDADAPAAGRGAPGTGRLVLVTVASTDGTPVYDSSALAPIPADRLVQVSKLQKIGGLHLAALPGGSGNAAAASASFDDRPAVASPEARIGGDSPAPSVTSFPFPVGAGAGAARYVFTKSLQFSPQGEVRVNNNASNLQPVVEISLRQAHGTRVDEQSRDVAAIQIAGVSGAVRIYRR